MGNSRGFWVSLLLICAVACAHDPVGVSPDHASQVAADSIRAANGRAFIGFKEAGQVRGVDPQGRVLTTAETVFRMKQFLKDQGIVFEVEYDLPAVAARLPLAGNLDALVRSLRANPNIDYVEPIFPGVYY